MLSTSDVVAKPAHGEEKKSENGEDGGNNSKACEHSKFIWNTRQHNPHGLVEESQTNQVTKDKMRQHTCEDCGRTRRWREKS